jgi:uncharacterized membrane protein (UPF0127 family)
MRPLPAPLPALLQRPDSPKWLQRAAVLVLCAGLLACAGEAGSGPADPTLLPPGVTQGPAGSTTAPPDGDVSVTRTPLPGFGEVAIEVVRVDGEVVSACLLLADTDALRQQGLMHVSDPGLGGYDGMLFRFEAPTDVGFWMRNTLLPLSLAYVGEDGALVSTHDMVPCDDPSTCSTTYAPSGPYRWAIEVPTEAGGVATLGLEPGASFHDLATGCSVSE